MDEISVEQATDAVYASIQDNNRDLDAQIAALKVALARAGRKEIALDPARLAQNNRAGRKLLQAYFRQRGVTVTFSV